MVDPRRHQHYTAVKKESAVWITSFRAFSPKAQHALDLCDASKSSRPVTLPVTWALLFCRSPCLYGLATVEER